jgi:O-antigen/teichoic acid export membrane protein
LAGGSVIAQAIALLAAPVITRLYEPPDFGALGVYASILAITAIVASLRYELAIPLPQDDRDAVSLLALCLGLVVIVSGVAAVFAQLAGPALIRALDVPQLEPILWLVPVGLLAAGTYQALSAWAVRTRGYATLARTRLIQSLGQVGTQLAAGLIGPAGAVGLVLGHAVGSSAGSGSLARLVRPERKDWPSMATVRRVASRYRRFPLVSSGSAVLNGLGLYLPPILLAYHYGPQAAGWYTLADRIIRAPLTLIGQAVAQVYLGDAARLAREDPARLRSLHAVVSRYLFVVGVPVVALVAWLGPQGFTWAFGGAWTEAGEFVRAMAVLLLMRFVALPLSQTLIVLERLDLQLAWDALRLLVVLAVFFAGAGLGSPVLTTVTWYGLAMAVAYAILVLLTRLALTTRASQGA